MKQEIADLIYEADRYKHSSKDDEETREATIFMHDVVIFLKLEEQLSGIPFDVLKDKFQKEYNKQIASTVVGKHKAILEAMKYIRSIRHT